MKIVTHELPRRTLEAFADEHNLELHVYERSTGAWYARFENTDWTEDDWTMGYSPESAIYAFTKAVSNSRLLIHADQESTKRWVQVPVLVPYQPSKDPLTLHPEEVRHLWDPEDRKVEVCPYWFVDKLISKIRRRLK